MSANTVAELTDLVLRKVQDDSYEDDILDLLNRCVNELAAEHPPLPDLFTSSTVDTTGNAYTDLPENYLMGLQKVFSSDQETFIKIMDFDTFLETYPTMAENEGTIVNCAVYGGKLYYNFIPDTDGSDNDALTLYYYRKPVEMEDDADTPDGIPCFYKEAVLVNFCAWKIFEEIEDGIEGRKVNAEFFKAQYDEAVSKMRTRNNLHDTLRKRSFSA